MPSNGRVAGRDDGLSVAAPGLRATSHPATTYTSTGRRWEVLRARSISCRSERGLPGSRWTIHSSPRGPLINPTRTTKIFSFGCGARDDAARDAEDEAWGEAVRVWQADDELPAQLSHGGRSPLSRGQARLKCVGRR